MLGEGSGVLFRRCSPAKARRSHLGLAGLARCQRHKMAEEPRADARPGGASQGRVGRVREKATLFGDFYPMLRQGKGRPVGP